MAQNAAGTPSPDNWIVHQEVTVSKAVAGLSPLHSGVAVTNGNAVSALVRCAGASRGRVRFKSTGAGSLKLEFVRPGGSQRSGVTVYGAGNPDAVAVTGGTETLLTTDAIAGEAMALITFTPSANGTVTFCDWMAL